MNKIEFPWTGVDGISRDFNTIKNWYEGEVKEQIETALKNGANRKKGGSNEWRLLTWLSKNVSYLLFANPPLLLSLTRRADKHLGNILWKTVKGRETSTGFGEEILECFNYKKYRGDVLIELSNRLNVKTCPYCNQHYTLYIEEQHGKKSELAAFQFDHFYSKVKYPFLSMSLFNLVPSCPTCNNYKSSKQLPPIFNPYSTAICELFKFRVSFPIKMFMGAKADDKTSICLSNTGRVSQLDLDTYEQTLHLTAQYNRHRDVVDEAFARAYVKEHYLEWTYSAFKSDSTLMKRLIHGTYMDETDINKRPLSKFYQDLYQQAKGKA